MKINSMTHQLNKTEEKKAVNIISLGFLGQRVENCAAFSKTSVAHRIDSLQLLVSRPEISAHVRVARGLLL